jgi:hypothetical protein
MPTRPWGRLEQAGELLIEIPHGLGIAPPVKTRAERPDSPLSENRPGLDGSRIGLGGDRAQGRERQTERGGDFNDPPPF